MVISGSVYQLLEFIINTLADGVRSTEIHRSTFHFQNLSGGNGHFIDRNVKIGVDSEDVIQNGRRGIGNTCEVEETVIG